MCNGLITNWSYYTHIIHNVYCIIHSFCILCSVLKDLLRESLVITSAHTFGNGNEGKTKTSIVKGRNRHSAVGHLLSNVCEKKVITKSAEWQHTFNHNQITNYVKRCFQSASNTDIGMHILHAKNVPYPFRNSTACFRIRCLHGPKIQFYPSKTVVNWLPFPTWQRMSSYNKNYYIYVCNTNN